MIWQNEILLLNPLQIKILEIKIQDPG